MNARERAKLWSRIVAKAWADADFKQRLQNAPADVMKEEGVDVSPGMTFKVFEDTDSIVHLVIPAIPKDLQPGESAEERVCAY